MLKVIVVVFCVLLCYCKPQQKCWCRENLEFERYRLIDWRQTMTYLADQSADSIMRKQCREEADRLKARVSELDLMLNEIK